jgi:hypothetical protein
MTPAWRLIGSTEAGRFGAAVAGAGDVNGDGYADALIADDEYPPDKGLGAVFVYLGSVSGLSETADTTILGDQPSVNFGEAIDSAGDVNGDAFADVLIGAFFYGGSSGEGLVQLHYGGGGAGRPLTPSQRRADDSAPIADRGRSRAVGRFRVGAQLWNPYGVSEVRLESEIERRGRPFDGEDTELSPWLNPGLSGTYVDQLLEGLDPAAYHWRLRVHYDPVMVSPHLASRWFTAPWNGSQERDLSLSPFVGGHVWDDQDADGIVVDSEPRLAGVLVHLLGEDGKLLDTTVTEARGRYHFDVGRVEAVRVHFEAPSGWAFTVQDRGSDDLLDSDASTVTGETALITSPFDRDDERRWSAGLRRVGPCTPPDEPVFVYKVLVNGDGYAVLHFQDPNQPEDITGYNVYRTADPSIPREQWRMIADDIVDMDESQPNKQWVDTSGDTSPTGLWHYQVAAYNHFCTPDTAEGPW